MAVFADPARDDTERLLSLGWYLSQRSQQDTIGMLRYVREGGDAGYQAGEVKDLGAISRHTRLIDALNRGRVWARKKLTAELDALLAPEIVIVVVPGHTPYGDEPPLRALGRAVAELQNRVDGTDILTRSTPIRRIAYGGPSYRQLHRETIIVAYTERITGQVVLLLDDIARSGASLRACRELLLEHGAAEVQALALGRLR
ncbi:MAG: phosphoribosyltransferase [Armatimonas sp.]